MGDATTTYSTTIAAGASLSGEVNIGNATPVALIFPSGWDAADVTFQAADGPGGTFNNVYDSDDAELTVQAALSRYVVLDPAKFCSLRNFKIRSGTSGSAVNQADAVVVTIVARPVG